MEKFLSLPKEKQDGIIDAAMSTFGTNGYKKTSVNDIAVAAGISKAMVFHYFGTKKKFYLYLLDVCGHTLMDELTGKFDRSVTDFFDRIILATEIKVAMMRRHPSILSFLYSAFYETDNEVKADIQALFTGGEGERFRQSLVFDGMDSSKFKEGIDPQVVMKLLTAYGYGYMNMTPNQTETNLDAVMKDFEDCIQLLKNNLYKENAL